MQPSGQFECELDALHLTSKIGNELKHVNRKSTPTASFNVSGSPQVGGGLQKVLNNVLLFSPNNCINNNKGG